MPKHNWRVLFPVGLREMSDHSDLRLYARFEYVECAMVYAEGESEPYRAMLVDIGLGGIQLRSKELLPVDRRMTIKIGQDGKAPLHLKGHVRYCHPTSDDGMYVSGFKFAPESHEERIQIAEYVHGVFQRQWQALAG
jgi:c-di-GMP-binding flagellar brake protein YcgR